MIALQITETKEFMNQLLKEELFHHFLLVEAAIMNGVTYTLDGKVSDTFRKEFPADFPYNFVLYKTVQPKLFEAVRGSHTPGYMKFIFCLTPENIQKTILSIHSSCAPEDVVGMYINIVFQGEHPLVTTGVSYRVFVKDYTLEQEWDRLVKLFFTKNELGFEIMS